MKGFLLRLKGNKKDIMIAQGETPTTDIKTFEKCSRCHNWTEKLNHIDFETQMSKGLCDFCFKEYKKFMLDERG